MSRAINLPMDRVFEMYEEGCSMREIGKRLGVNAQTVCNYMRKEGITARRPGQAGHHFGEHHHNWKGDKASRSALHFRIDRLYGKPKKCSTCGTTDPSKIYEWANLTGKYADPLDYKRMCRSCHRTYDHARCRDTGRYTSPGFKHKRYRGVAK